MKNARHAMNSIPLTFNEKQINRTVLGGKENTSKTAIPVTCLILMRGGNQYRTRVFENMEKLNFAEVISVEKRGGGNISEQLSRQFPFVKFVSTEEDVTDGDMLNIGMAESSCRYVLVLHDDLCTENFNFTGMMAKKLASLEQFCVVPRLNSNGIQSIPINFIPGVSHSVLEITSTINCADGMPTLYPFDQVGFYDREKFIRLGGADYTITSAYWQNLDLAFRAWLWGEKITISSAFQFTYNSDVPGEVQTPDASYLRFYLKNLLPVFEIDHAYIPKTSFFTFRLRSSFSTAETIKQFKNARQWTQENKYRFKYDASLLIENWGK